MNEMHDGKVDGSMQAAESAIRINETKCIAFPLHIFD